MRRRAPCVGAGTRSTWFSVRNPPLRRKAGKPPRPAGPDRDRRAVRDAPVARAKPRRATGVDGQSHSRVVCRSIPFHGHPQSRRRMVGQVVPGQVQGGPPAGRGRHEQDLPGPPGQPRPRRGRQGAQGSRSWRNAKTREHFRREIHITSHFQHPHAVAYYDADPNAAAGPGAGHGVPARRRSEPAAAPRQAVHAGAGRPAAGAAVRRLAGGPRRRHRPPRPQAGQPDDPLPRHAAGDG